MSIIIAIALIIAAALIIFILVINQKPAKNYMLVINDAIDGKKRISAADFTGRTALEVKVSEPMTVAGKADNTGMAMAIILDAMLGKGFEPDGFVQGKGWRIYHYKRMRR